MAGNLNTTPKIAVSDGAVAMDEAVNPEGMDDELEVFVEIHFDLFEGDKPTTVYASRIGCAGNGRVQLS